MNKVFKRNMVIAVCLMLAVIGCGKVETHGKPVELTTVTPVSAILADAKGYAGKTVLIDGKITLECPSGCWFDVSDDTGNIYVDIASGGGFSIPQHTGKNIKVEGIVEVRVNGLPFINGTGVEIR